MALKFQLRRGSAAQWSSTNPTLAAGEMGIETDTGKAKVGNGTSAWNDLSYFVGGPGTQGTTGSQGTSGTQGTNGTQGTLGTQGARGSQGTLGTQGTTGSQGTSGTQGTNGTQGTLGTQGARGSQGTNGTQGTTGSQGTSGTQGIQGVTGSLSQSDIGTNPNQIPLNQYLGSLAYLDSFESNTDAYLFDGGSPTDTYEYGPEFDLGELSSPDETIKFQFRRGNTSQWSSANPVLANGEIGIDTSTNPRLFKIGDGANNWNSLPYGGLQGIQGVQGAAGSGASSLLSSNNIFTNTNIFTVNSTSTALEVRQTGSGLALRVEDSTNPDATPFVVDASGRVGIGLSNPTQALHVVGNVVATGTITASFSDERLKEKLGNVNNSIEIIQTLNGFKYKNNDLAKTFGYGGDSIQIGLSAQEVQNVLPEIVSLAPFDMARDEEDNLISKSGENYLTLDYAKLVPVLVEAVKELKSEIEKIKENK